MEAYLTSGGYEQLYKSTMLEDTGSDNNKSLYGKDLMTEVHNFAHRAAATFVADPWRLREAARAVR